MKSTRAFETHFVVVLKYSLIKVKTDDFISELRQF